MSEQITASAPTPTAPPVVVIPVPARGSRTLQLGNILSMIGGALTVLPELAADPIVVAFLNEVMSAGARRTFGVLMFLLGFYVRYLRKTTAAPIAGTPAAVSQANLPVQSAPTATEGDTK